MKLKYIIIVLMLATSAWALSAEDASPWTQSFGATDTCLAQALRRCEDGGYVVLGNLRVGIVDAIYVVKTDSAGHIQWTRTYGGLRIEPHDIQAVSDSGYIIAGTQREADSTFDRAYLLRIGEQGDSLWSGTFGDKPCGARAVQPTVDGGYIVAGWMESTAAWNGDLLLAKLDVRGQLSWLRTYGSDGDEWASAVRVTADGGYVAAGGARPKHSRQDQMYVVKTDEQGVLQWSQAFAGDESQRADDVLETTQGYVLGGVQWYSSPEVGKFALAMTDPEGQRLWQRTYSRTFTSYDHTVLRAAGSGVMAAAYRFSLGTTPRDLCLIRVDDAGEMRWRRLYSGSGEVVEGWYGGYREVDAADVFEHGLRDFYELPSLPDSVQCSITRSTPIPARYGRRWWQKYCFCSGAEISFSLPSSQNVSITVVDRNGNVVQTIAEDYYLAGKHTEVVNGGLLPVGVYFVTFRAGACTKMQKMMVVG